MGLNWPGAHMVGGDMEEADKAAITALLDDFGDRLLVRLQALGLPPHASPLWRPWNLVVARDAEKVLAAFSVLTGGMANLQWLDRKSQLFPPQELARAIRDELGQQIAPLVILPLPEAPDRTAVLDTAARQHAAEVERASRLGR